MSMFGEVRTKAFMREGSKSRTVNSEASKTDIRRILAASRRSGGPVAYMTTKQAHYADISEVPDYITALNIVARARSQFDLLPAAVRDRFNNDPGKFLAFASDPENSAEMVKLGLRAPDVVPEEPKPMRVEVVNPEPPKSS